ncbi:hypothetical protein RAH41_08095 [Gottfriedia acidiceleris]|uniref:hypothetical protein n=1 Tax=Gottfriedia acidiceleris TaxID=371036 RepID=UPI002F26AB7A
MDNNIVNQAMDQAYDVGMLNLKFTLLKVLGAGVIITILVLIIMICYFSFKTKYMRDVKEIEQDYNN